MGPNPWKGLKKISFLGVDHIPQEWRTQYQLVDSRIWVEVDTDHPLIMCQRNPHTGQLEPMAKKHCSNNVE